jgi:hypothetical protein
MEQLRLNQIEDDPKRPEAVPVPLGPDSSTNACSIYRCKSLDSSIASYFLTRLKFSKRANLISGDSFLDMSEDVLAQSQSVTQKRPIYLVSHPVLLWISSIIITTFAQILDVRPLLLDNSHKQLLFTVSY